MGVRNNEHSIRILAVYTILKSAKADKPVTTKKILAELEKEYHIKSSRATLYLDLEAIRLFEDIRGKPYRGFWIKQDNAPTIKSGDKFYHVYFSDDKKRYKIDELVAAEVSDKRVWFDNGCCEIDIGDFGKSAFTNYQKARETAERLNNEK